MTRSSMARRRDVRLLAAIAVAAGLAILELQLLLTEA